MTRQYFLLLFLLFLLFLLLSRLLLLLLLDWQTNLIVSSKTEVGIIIYTVQSPYLRDHKALRNSLVEVRLSD